MKKGTGSAGERVRVAHALARAKSAIESIWIALQDETTPIGLEATQALVQTAVDLSNHAAAADAYLRAGCP
jgi:hypothetical protein